MFFFSSIVLSPMVNVPFWEVLSAQSMKTGWAFGNLLRKALMASSFKSMGLWYTWNTCLLRSTALPSMENGITILIS